MKRELTGRGFLLYIGAFFLVVFAVNGYFAYVAVATFSGADEAQAYRDGVQYNTTLARRARQAKLGWSATIDADRLASGKVRIAVTLKKRDGSPASNLALNGQLQHPSDETRDRSLHLVEIRAGDYEADLAGVSPGVWDVFVATPGNAVPFEATRRLWVH